MLKKKYKNRTFFPRESVGSCEGGDNTLSKESTSIMSGKSSSISSVEMFPIVLKLKTRNLFNFSIAVLEYYLPSTTCYIF